MRHHFLVGSIVLALVFPACLRAQKATLPRVSVDALVSRTQVGQLDSPGTDAASGILSQRRPGYSARDRARLEAALVQTALADSAAAGPAIAALAIAGAASAPVPLPTAFDDLQRLYHGAPTVGNRGAALGSMGGLADRQRVLQFLAGLAADSTGSYPTAPAAAVMVLARDGGEAGRRILQQLYEGNQAKNWLVGAELRRMAATGFFKEPLQPR